MKHCHFSILCNELPHLKQKLPFLYEHFDQLIFYDLNVKTHEYSTDGSHKHIRNFPDPKRKLTLIEETRDKRLLPGPELGKRGMFQIGSGYVREDMDVFWCTDMDEYFRPELIQKVEDVLQTTNANTVLVPHLIFFHNTRWVFVLKSSNSERVPLAWPRIVRHRKGNVYGHCDLQVHYPPTHELADELLYHFAFIGEERQRFKTTIHMARSYYEEVWKKFDGSKVSYPPGGMYGYPEIHPNRQYGIRRNTHEVPSYIDLETLMQDLGASAEAKTV